MNVCETKHPPNPRTVVATRSYEASVCPASLGLFGVLEATDCRTLVEADVVQLWQ